MRFAISCLLFSLSILSGCTSVQTPKAATMREEEKLMNRMPQVLQFNSTKHQVEATTFSGTAIYKCEKLTTGFDWVLNRIDGAIRRDEVLDRILVENNTFQKGAARFVVAQRKAHYGVDRTNMPWLYWSFQSGITTYKWIDHMHLVETDGGAIPVVPCISDLIGRQSSMPLSGIILSWSPSP